MAVAWIVAVCVFVAGGMTSMQAKWPPEENPGWTVFGLLSFVPLVLLVRAAQISGYRRHRAAIGIVFLFAFAGFWEQIYGYYINFRDHPLVPLVGGVLIFSAGAVVLRQWIALAVLWLFLAGTFGPGLLPPEHQLPATMSRDGLTVTWHPRKARDHVDYGTFMVSGPPGIPLGKTYDLAHAEAIGDGGPLLGIYNEHARAEPPIEYRGADFIWPPNEAYFNEWLFPPSWMRSYYLTVVVPEWPKPVLRLNVQVPARGSHNARINIVSNKDAFLRVENLDWGSSERIDPKELVMKCRVVATPGWYGSSNRQLAAFSDSGDPLIMVHLQEETNEIVVPPQAKQEERYEIEVPPSIKQIEFRLYLYGEGIPKPVEHVFRFGRVPSSRFG